LRKNSESGSGWLYKNPKSPENTPKKRKKQQLTENQRNSKYQKTSYVGVLFLHLACQRGGAVRTSAPVSYATYQVHFKHEQPQLLSPDSLVTIRTIRKRRTQPTCFAYIDTIVGMRLA